MAQISAKEVREIAILARLELDDAACERLAAELGEVLEHMSVLDDVDVDGIEPLTHVADLRGGAAELRLRPDDVVESLPESVALAAAPETEDGCFRVPSSIAAEDG